MTQFEVWKEGYRATGESCGASYCGRYEAETFKEAVYRYIETLEEKERSYFSDNEYGLRYWGCKFYDNEEDARKKFG